MRTIEKMDGALRRAALQEGWLPNITGIPEFDALRERHLTARRVLTEASNAVHEIRARHEAEDERRKEAIREAVFAGRPPDVTAPDTAAREEELAPAQEIHAAAMDAFVDVVWEVCDGIRDVAPEVDRLVMVLRREADDERREAEKRIEAANNRLREVRRLAQWMERAIPERRMPGYANDTGERLPPQEYPYFWALAYSEMELPPPDVVPSAELMALTGRTGEPAAEGPADDIDSTED